MRNLLFVNLGVCLTVMLGLMITKDANCLWALFFLVPLNGGKVMNVHVGKEDEE
jgi:hypothetical protein